MYRVKKTVNRCIKKYLKYVHDVNKNTAKGLRTKNKVYEHLTINETQKCKNCDNIF